MQAIILLVALILLASAFAFLAIYIEDRKSAKEEFPLLSDEEWELLWSLAKGDEQEFKRLATFEQKVKMVETEYSLSLSIDPRAHRRMAILFSQWGKEWDKEHGLQD